MFQGLGSSGAATCSAAPDNHAPFRPFEDDLQSIGLDGSSQNPSTLMECILHDSIHTFAYDVCVYYNA